MKPNLTTVCEFCKTVKAKIAPWCLARRESFSAKAPGLVAGVTAPPTLTAPTRNRYRQV